MNIEFKFKNYYCKFLDYMMLFMKCKDPKDINYKD